MFVDRGCVGKNLFQQEESSGPNSRGGGIRTPGLSVPNAAR